MKNLFPGYIKKSPEEINSLWENAIICTDTNVLLDLYRYSEETKTALLQLITGLKKQMMLPRHVAWEYQRKRYDVIVQQYEPYESAGREIRSLLEKINSDTAHPFFSKKLSTLAAKLSGLIITESEETKKSIDSQLQSDTIFEELSEIFSGKIGEELDKKIDIEKIGSHRYNHKIPPGYKDQKKVDNIYGDLIMWLQIIDIAKHKKKPIILITNDQKEDWWWIIKGDRKIGPRPELISEIQKESGQDFHIYTTLGFLEFGNKFLNRSSVTDKVLNEVKLSDSFHKELSITFGNSAFEDFLQAIRLSKLRTSILESIEETGSITTQDQANLLEISLEAKTLYDKISSGNHRTKDSINKYLVPIISDLPIEASKTDIGLFE